MDSSVSSGLSGGFFEGVGGNFEARELSFSQKFLFLLPYHPLFGGLARSNFFILTIRATFGECDIYTISKNVPTFYIVRSRDRTIIS